MAEHPPQAPPLKGGGNSYSSPPEGEDRGEGVCYHSNGLLSN